MGLGSLALGIYGAASADNAAKSAANAQKDKMNILKQQMAFNRKWFDKQYYSNLLQRTDIQGALKTLRDNIGIQRQRDEARAEVSGATDEAKLAAQESRNKTYADAQGTIASEASRLKDSYLNQYMQNMNNSFSGLLGYQDSLSNVYSNIAAQRSQASANAFGSAFNQLGKGLDSSAKTFGWFGG